MLKWSIGKSWSGEKGNEERKTIIPQGSALSSCPENKSERKKERRGFQRKNKGEGCIPRGKVGKVQMMYPLLLPKFTTGGSTEHEADDERSVEPSEENG